MLGIYSRLFRVFSKLFSFENNNRHFGLLLWKYQINLPAASNHQSRDTEVFDVADESTY